MKLKPSLWPTVARLRNRYAQLHPEYKQNTFERLAFENGNVSADLIFFSLGMPYDQQRLINLGLATKT